MQILINKYWRIETDSKQWILKNKIELADSNVDDCWRAYYYFTDYKKIAAFLSSHLDEIGASIGDWPRIERALDDAIREISDAITEQFGNIKRADFIGRSLALPSSRELSADADNFITSNPSNHHDYKYHARLGQAIIKDFCRMVLSLEEKRQENCTMAIQILKDQYIAWIHTNSPKQMMKQLDGVAV